VAETLRVIVAGARYRAEASNFSVLECRAENSPDELIVVGNFPLLHEGELIAATGEWRTTRWGRQFHAESIVPIIPNTVAGVQAYLAAGRVDGIGKKMAARLVKHFGADLLRIIDEEPRRLLEVRGLGERTLQLILWGWQRERGVRDIFVFLASIGINGSRADRIHEQYGANSVAAIRNNPYVLAYEVRGIGFQVADSIARKLGHDERSQFRFLAALRHVLDQARHGGHCGIAADEAIAQASELLAIPQQALNETADVAVKTGIVIQEMVDGRSFLFEPFLYRAESAIAKRLAALADEQPAWTDLEPAAAIEAAQEESGIELDATQRAAIELALHSKAIVVTGGPGVGKTTLVRALLELYHSAGLTVSLAAPTGRAAKRLSESTGSTALTIHRLLETSPHSGHFQRDEENPLETDVVVIDEASMIDVPLLDAILRAMPPRTAIVLVGDADQLPSIGPGQVLHDILASERVPSIRLTEIHRQAEGSDIVLNAHRIHRGEMPSFGQRDSQSNMFLFAARSPEEAVAHIIELVSKKIPAKFGLNPLRDVQVLAPMRKGPAGVHALNQRLQAVLNPPERRKSHVERANGELLASGDKVMQTENNYDKNVFNGDIGVVATIDEEGERFVVDFGGDLIVDYTFDESDQLTLAYTTTIHKSQGSEYEAVVIAMMPEHYVMLQRNLLYTAVTRGRKLVVIVGDRRSVQKAVSTGGGGERRTRLGRCLVTA